MASCLHLLLLVLCSLSVAQSQLRLFNLRATDLPSDLLGITDAYLKVYSGSVSLGKTSTRHNNVNPWWDEEFSYFYSEENDVLKIEVYDSDLIFDDVVGVCQRALRYGTYEHDCYLEKGGILHYTYTLGYSQ